MMRKKEEKKKEKRALTFRCSLQLFFHQSAADIPNVETATPPNRYSELFPPFSFFTFISPRGRDRHFAAKERGVAPAASTPLTLATSAAHWIPVLL